MRFRYPFAGVIDISNIENRVCEPAQASAKSRAHARPFHGTGELRFTHGDRLHMSKEASPY